MELNQEYKCYLCRFCNQIISNGDEYRFHIRRHIALFSGTQEQSINYESRNRETDVEIDVESDGVNAYGLRENPNKSWRVLNSKQISNFKKILCSKCDKGFDSVKALHGHMRYHSINKSRLFGKASSSSSEDGKSNPGVKPEFGNVVRKKRSFTRYNNIHTNPNNDPSSSFSVNEDEEEGVFGLLMLSRGLRDSDVLMVKNVISTNYKSDASVDESMMSSENVAKSNLRSNSQDVRVKGKRKAYDDQKDHKCSVCCKEFGSGQALGGHMRAHYHVTTSNETGIKEYSTDSFKVRRRLDFNVGIVKDNDNDNDDDYFNMELE